MALISGVVIYFLAADNESTVPLQHLFAKAVKRTSDLPLGTDR